MFTKEELQDAVNQLKEGQHSIQNCERLAAIYTVLDHLYEEPLYSNSNNIDVIGMYGTTKFLKMIADKPERQVWLLIDELIEALSVLEPKLLNNFYEKLDNIR